MPVGRPPKPIEVKRQLGTLRSDRLSGEPIVIEQPDKAPAPPERLGKRGREFWLEIYESAKWVSHSTDRPLMEIAADLFDEREELKQLVTEDPSNPRLRSSLRQLEKSLMSQLALLGLTPSDRSRLGFAEVKRESKLDELLRRINDRDT